MSDGLGWTLLSMGGVLVYAGAKGYSVPKLLSNLVVGQPINDGAILDQPLTTPGVTAAQAQPNAALPGASTHSASTETARANQTTANIIARGYGWDEGVQWDSLVELWNRESSWDNTAQNPDSGAYGIPQALPYTKMPKTAWPPSAGGISEPAAQITWGLDYIAGRYGVPQFALAFHKQNNWY